MVNAIYLILINPALNKWQILDMSGKDKKQLLYLFKNVPIYKINI